MKRVTRITNGAPESLRITFNGIGRGLEWSEASAGGTPQDVEDSVADTIARDASLATHFKIEECAIATPKAPAPAAVAKEPAIKTPATTTKGK